METQAAPAPAAPPAAVVALPAELVTPPPIPIPTNSPKVSDQDKVREGQSLSYDTEDAALKDMGSMGRKHSSDRRPLRFWQPFNDWWRQEFEKLERRPTAQEIHSW